MYYCLNRFLFLSAMLFISACSARREKTDEEKIPIRLTSDNVPIIKTVACRYKPFAVQLLANGKISALQQAKLHFKTGGVIDKIYVANNYPVKKGQLLAQLDNKAQQISLLQAQEQFHKATTELNSLILQYGGADQDTSSVNNRVRETLKVKSGYYEALTALANARLQLSHTYLEAPYSGTVANLKSRAYNLITTAEPFCDILNRQTLVIEFSVLESELTTIQVGQSAQIFPVALLRKKYSGKVFEINPVVSEQGLIKIKVKITNADADLFEGMNAKVIIEKQMDRQLVVPKEAVVERSGKKVVFTYESGLAKWHYVTISYENSTEVAVSEGLKSGEVVIINGNLNLGHDAPVQLEK
jgi:RND family efflux transporter MFP subunit